MIRVTVQDLHKDSPRCSDACGKYQVDGCGACTLRFRVAWKCKNCGVVKHFYGANNPNNCPVCKTMLPDLYALAQAKHHYVRVKYYLEES